MLFWQVCTTFARTMDGLRVHIYSKGDQLPLMKCRNYFHSEALFHVCEQTPRLRPYMVVVQRNDGAIICHLLAILRYRSSLFPPYLYMHCRIYGVGDYDEEYEESMDELFDLMLDALTRKTAVSPE